MNINTKFFGIVDISEEKIIHFSNGIPGFEQFKNFIIFDINDKTTLKCLQSVENSGVCLLMITPWEYYKEYAIELSDEEVDELKIDNQEEIGVFNVINIKDGKITANLVAPVIINLIKKVGKQIILSNAKYNLRQEIPCLY